MILKLEPDPLPLRVEPGGGIRIGNTRVHFEIVIEAFDARASPESIVQAYDTLDLSDVYAVIAFYLRHKGEVKAYVAQRNQKAEEWRQKLEAEGISRPNFYQELLAQRAGWRVAVLRLLTDEDIDGDILRGLRRRLPHADILRVQEVGLRTETDHVILDWAARDGRIVISNDRDTMIGFAYDRVNRGLPMPGLFVLRGRSTTGEVIEALVIAIECSNQEEWKDRVQFLP